MTPSKGLRRIRRNFRSLTTARKTFLKEYPHATLRKVRVERDPHSFRLIFVHWILPDDDEIDEHVDVIDRLGRGS